MGEQIQRLQWFPGIRVKVDFILFQVVAPGQGRVSKANLSGGTPALRSVLCGFWALLVKVIIFTEHSGLNENRRGLRMLFRLVSKDHIDVVMVEFKDRLARFGYAYIQEALRFRGVEIELLEQQETKDATQEKVQNMLAIVAVFAAKLY